MPGQVKLACVLVGCELDLLDELAYLPDVVVDDYEINLSLELGGILCQLHRHRFCGLARTPSVLCFGLVVHLAG